MRRFISMSEEDGTTVEFGARSSDTDADISAAPWYIAMTPPGADPEWKSVVLNSSTRDLLGFLLDAGRMIQEAEGLQDLPAPQGSEVLAANLAVLKAAANDPDATDALTRGPGPRPGPPLGPRAGTGRS